MDKIHEGKLYLDEQVTTKTDDMSGEEVTEYSYIVVPIDGVEITDSYEQAIANGDEFKATREHKKNELAKQKNKWLADVKVAYPEYIPETYTEQRELTEDEKTVNDTDEDGMPIERAEDYVYPTVEVILEYPYITVIPEVPAIEAVEEVTDEDGNVLTEGVKGVDAVLAYEVRRPSDYKTMEEWLSGAAMPELVEPVEAEGVQLLTKKKAKIAKQKTLDNLSVTANTVMYDANGKAMGNMSTVIGIANFKFNQALAQGVAPEDAYDAVYKTEIGWKCADNEVHRIQVENICEAAEAGIRRIATIVGAE